MGFPRLGDELAAGCSQPHVLSSDPVSLCGCLSHQSIPRETGWARPGKALGHLSPGLGAPVGKSAGPGSVEGLHKSGAHIYLIKLLPS